MNTIPIDRLLAHYSRAFDIAGFHFQRLAAHGLRTRPAATGEAPCTVTLQPMEVWQTEAEPGLTLESLNGQVWLTQTGDAADHIVKRGQLWRAERRGRIVVQAMSHATFQVRK